LGPGARAGVPSPPVVAAGGTIITKPHIYEAVMGNTYLVLSHCHGGWRCGEGDPGIGGGAWIGDMSDRDAIRDEEGGCTAAAGATKGGPHLVAAGLTTGHAHRYGPRGTPSWEGRRGDHGAGTAVLIDSDLIAGSPCDRRPVRSKAASRYARSGIGCERSTAPPPAVTLVRRLTHPVPGM